ncbi:hypothetical protein LCGC14_2582710 [marine sediment metagenome]|uniref:Uncharacterized protein n=1 Tax=marine sediment metagenome TaxID=412755 RepID=A0A0F9AEF0_9ZZZZ
MTTKEKTTRRAYIKHIRRLQSENRILVQVIAEERTARQAAYSWYSKKLNSKFMWIIHGIIHFKGMV